MPLTDGRIRSGIFSHQGGSFTCGQIAVVIYIKQKKNESTKGKKDLNVTIIYIYTRTFHIDVCMHHFVQLYVYTILHSIYIYIMKCLTIYLSHFKSIRRAVGFFRCFPSKSHPNGLILMAGWWLFASHPLKNHGLRTSWDYKKSSQLKSHNPFIHSMAPVTTKPPSSFVDETTNPMGCD